MQDATLSAPVQPRPKRARSQLSCISCRKGKLKCNRSKPCDQCEKRNREDACTYSAPVANTRQKSDVKSRIGYLERLVINLMNTKDVSVSQDHSTARTQCSDLQAGTSTCAFPAISDYVDSRNQPTPPDSEVDTVGNRNSTTLQFSDGISSDVIGRLKISGSQTSYVGSAHWASILNGISDLKQELEHVEEDGDELDDWQSENVVTSDVTDVSDTHSLLRTPKALTRADLLEALPAKSVVDQLVNRWFNSSDPFRMIIHKNQFESEYRNFWADPKKAPVMWLGLLYAIMSMGCFLRLQTYADFASRLGSSICMEADTYLDLSAAAAVLADYLTPKAYTIEMLLLYMNQWRTKAAASDVWILMGVVVRLALRMGYHRDADHYALFTPYVGEMRRRTYAVLYMADVLTSFQLGLPAMLRSIQSDTKPPHNLLDRDFSIETKQLPPSRSTDDFTPSGYGNAKVRICRVFSDAAELSHATKPPSYDVVMQTDVELEEAKSKIPSPLRARASEMYLFDSPNVTLCSIHLDVMYLKAKCVLHRRFMTPTASEPAQSYSRRSCVESAMHILRHQHTLVEASQPGGRLDSVAWHIENTSKADYLFAAVIICVELNQSFGGPSLNSDSEDGAATSRSHLIKALEKTKTIWEEAIRQYTQSTVANGTARHRLTQRNGILQETIKASRAVSIMLQTVRARHADRDSIIPSAPDAAHQNGSGTTPGSSQLNADVPSVEGYPIAQGWQTGFDDNADPTDYSMIGNLMDSIDNVDWASWDQRLGIVTTQDDFQDWPMNDVTGDVSVQSFDFGALEDEPAYAS